MAEPDHRIRYISEYIDAVRRDSVDLGITVNPWFRGEPKVRKPLVPRLFRPKREGSQHHENKLLQQFRMKAPAFGAALK